MTQLTNAELINQSSGEFEYYTPLPIIEAARKAMGSIDLDPATSKIANRRIRAASIFTLNNDGLLQKWFGNVWLNHPFGRRLNPLWIENLCDQWRRQNVAQVCCITYACTSEKWFRPLLERPQCFLSPRTNYLLPDGTVKKGVTKGSVVTYFGDRIGDFANAFRPLGEVKVPYPLF